MGPSVIGLAHEQALMCTQAHDRLSGSILKTLCYSFGIKQYLKLQYSNQILASASFGQPIRICFAAS